MKRSISSIARTEYLRWITNPRILIIGILIVFIRSLAIEPLLEHAEKMGDKLHVLEPFIAAGNSSVLVMLIPLFFLILMSDYPKVTGETLFFIQRSGRIRWYLGQFVFRLIALFSYLGGLLLGTMLFSGGVWKPSWSDVVTKFKAFFPDESLSFASKLLPSNLYNQMTVGMALLHTVLLIGCYLILLSEILCFFKLIHKGQAGIYAVVLLIAAGMVTCTLGVKEKWIFPMAHTIPWVHFDIILRESQSPIWHSYLYFVIAIGTMVLLNLHFVRRMQFYNTENTD